MKHFVEKETSYSSLDVQLIEAEVDEYKLTRFLIIVRKVKCFDRKIGPYDCIKLVVKEDGTLSFSVYDKIIEEGRVKAPLVLSSGSILSVLGKLAEPCMVVCTGIQNYSILKASIGYDLSRVVLVSCPPHDSVRDYNCPVLYEKKSSRRKLSTCSKCNSLKWQLSRPKCEHEQLTPAERKVRQSSSSSVPFDY